jgi:hypothetical protein
MNPKPEQTTQRLDTLLHCEDNLETDLGAWFAGERVVFRGKDLFTELADLPWMGLLLYGITGRIMDEKQIHLFQGMWSVCASYPDPRIWNNGVASLAGTTRSTVSLGAASAIAVSSARIYGGQADFNAIQFLKRAAAIDPANGEDLADFVLRTLREKRVVPGFGRPITKVDERIAPLMRFAKSLGFHNGRHVKLTFEIERILQQNRRRLRLNIAGLAAALAADQGLTEREYAGYVALDFGAGIIPCYFDAADKPEGSFFPLRCDRISYAGPEPREWN